MKQGVPARGTVCLEALLNAFSWHRHIDFSRRYCENGAHCCRLQTLHSHVHPSIRHFIAMMMVTKSDKLYFAKGDGCVARSGALQLFCHALQWEECKKNKFKKEFNADGRISSVPNILTILKQKSIFLWPYIVVSSSTKHETKVSN